MFSFTLILLFMSNLTAICKNEIPPTSESEMIIKELESSHLSSFSVNLRDAFEVPPNIVGKLSPNSVKNVIYHQVETHNYVHNILRLFSV